MKNFATLNGLSFLYALMIALPFELLINVLRISRLTSLSLNTVFIFSFLIAGLGITALTLFVVILFKKWSAAPKLIHFSAILWLPYFILFVFIGASLFPTARVDDIPSAATGLIALGMLMIFPLYIIFINQMGSHLSQ